MRGSLHVQKDMRYEIWGTGDLDGIGSLDMRDGILSKTWSGAGT